MSKILEMIFKTGQGKKFRLTLSDPRDDVTGQEIQTVMDLIISKNPFDVDGGLAEIDEVNIITTDISPVVLQ